MEWKYNYKTVMNGVLVIIIAILTISVQAIKAATANPVNAIKSN
jgi:hypothetical protein